MKRLRNILTGAAGVVTVGVLAVGAIGGTTATLADPGWNAVPAVTASADPGWNSEPIDAAPVDPGWNSEPAELMEDPGWN